MARLMSRGLKSRISVWVLMALLIVVFTLFYRVNDAMPAGQFPNSTRAIPLSQNLPQHLKVLI